MKFSDLQLTQAQRLELLAQSHWSIEEAACYFCDVKAVDLNKLSPVELQVLYETQVIYDIEERLPCRTGQTHCASHRLRHAAAVPRNSAAHERAFGAEGLDRRCGPCGA